MKMKQPYRYSNTTLVKVKYMVDAVEYCMLTDSNTTLVKVKYVWNL